MCEIMTFEQFRNTAQFTMDLSSVIADDGWENAWGFIYHGKVFLEEKADCVCYLILGNQEWFGRKEDLEKWLYEYACREGYCRHENHSPAVQQRLLLKGTRDEIIEWLVWNDRDGCYSDEDRLCEGFEPYTPRTARRALRLALAE